MGVQKLHSFLLDRCQHCIHEIHIKDLRNKKVAVDISMFLYKFKQEKKLLGNMYALCQLFRLYNIHPIFIFDGKPNKEKLKMIAKRRYTKMEMLKKMEELKKKQLNSTISEQIKYYEKQSMSISKDDIQNVRILLDLCGMTWVRSSEEADSYISYLAIYNYVDYVISDDTDMFAYGCMHVLRQFDLENQVMYYYNTQEILDTLSLTKDEFKYLCVNSKNDYMYHRYIRYFSDNYSLYLTNHYINDVNNMSSYYSLDTIKKESIPIIKNKSYEKNDVIEYLKIHGR